MNRIKHDQGRDKLTILKNACSYFEQTDRQGLVSVLTSVQQAIQDQLAELESQKANIKDKMSTLFSSEEMKQCPYDVRATFHHDGKSGTGHYWAYIYVEPSEISLLEDIPAKEEGGWFKFCDASVSPVSEDALWNDPVAPFAMLYADRSIQRWTKDQLKACLPESLNEFIQEDHALLEQEIKDYQQPPPPPPQEMVLMNETPSPPPLLSLEEPEEDEKYMFTGEGFNQLKTKVNEAISFAHTLAKDDAVFLKKFEAFLARSQNHAALEHLYLLYSSEEGVNEEASKQDDELELIWTEYNHYIDLGKYMVEALDWFVKKDYSHAIDSLLAVKRQEAQWKTRLMLDQGMSDAYPGLETLSFQDLVTSFGQHALKALNDLVFAKAINPAYRFSGLQDGVRVAQQAQSMMGPDTEQEEVYQSLQNQWLSFTDQIKDELTEEEANLLNTLIMTWIEGGSENEKIDSVPVISSDLPLWQKYQQLRETSELILSFQQ
ncbi:hypothetical protein BD560DRAFT_323363 [Blakeslea trispora]|nr:hypothetical protein BD560DRAFT_323363 [Blakeslea trispora]